MKRVIFALAAASLVSGCGVFGGKGDKKTTPTIGERIPVLSAEAAIQVDPQEYLMELRMAHNLPVQSFDGMFTVPMSKLDDIAEDWKRLVPDRGALRLFLSEATDFIDEFAQIRLVVHADGTPSSTVSAKSYGEVVNFDLRNGQKRRRKTAAATHPNASDISTAASP